MCLLACLQKYVLASNMLVSTNSSCSIILFSSTPFPSPIAQPVPNTKGPIPSSSASHASISFASMSAPMYATPFLLCCLMVDSSCVCTVSFSTVVSAAIGAYAAMMWKSFSHGSSLSSVFR